jgi:hypothetical protein
VKSDREDAKVPGAEVKFFLSFHYRVIKDGILAQA